MYIIFKEIIKENKQIKNAKEEVQNNFREKNIHAGRKGFNTMQTKMEIGKMVEEALQNKKENESEKIVDILRKTAFDNKLNKTVGDEMFINAGFLVDKGREKEFDNIMDDLSDKYKNRIRFLYTGPLPVFNFVNINIYQEEWEK